MVYHTVASLDCFFFLLSLMIYRMSAYQSVEGDAHCKRQLTKAVGCFFGIKRNVPLSTPKNMKVIIYCSSVLSILLLGSQFQYPSRIFSQKSEKFHVKALNWVVDSSID